MFTPILKQLLTPVVRNIFDTYGSKMFSPVDLFTTGINGAWYDPSDLTTLYQDAAGTIPVTAVEQPVGLMKDKSGRGNHAFNPSGNSANFPVLSARYNLLTKTEQFDDNGGWEKQNTLVAVANQSIAPDGTISADLLYPGTSGIHRMVRSLAVINYSTRSTYSFYVKSAGFRYIGLFNMIGNAPGVYFDLQLGTKTVYDAGITATITPSTNGFYLCSLTQNSGYTAIYLSDTEGSYTATANGTSGIYIWGASLVPADQSSLPYQRVNTATDYDTVGFKPYLKFNGTNQWLQTNSVDFTLTDKMFVCAGIRKLSDASSAILAELSVNFNTNNGSFFVTAPDSTTTSGNYASISRGNALASTGQAAKSSTLLSPITSVLSATHNIIGDLSALRINGSPNGTNGIADKGSGNFGNYPIYIGARAGSSLWFNGRLYQMVVAGKQASDAEITSTETYINQKTGAY